MMKIDKVYGGECYGANIITDDGVKELLRVVTYCLGYMASSKHKHTIETCNQLAEILSECKRVVNIMENE